MKAKNIIIIENSDKIINLISKKIQSPGCFIFKLNSSALDNTGNILKFSPDLIIIHVDAAGAIPHSEAIEKIREHRPVQVIFIMESDNEVLFEELRKTNPFVIFIQPVHEAEILSAIETALQKAAAENTVLDIKNPIEEAVNEKSLLEAEEDERFASLFDDSPIPICVEDFSEVKNHFDVLKNSGVANFREYFESNPGEIRKCASLISVIDLNKEARKFFNFTPQNKKIYSVASVFLPESYRVFKEEMIELAEGKTSFENEISIQNSKNESRVVILKVKVTPGSEKNLKRILVSFLDITERKNSEEYLKASLKEKEILLKEIHHRVKNNLQIISSLLNLQSEYITDKVSKELFNDSLNRIRSMALIHERLYQSKNFSQINVSDYVKDVTNYLLRTYKTNIREIKIDVEIEQLCVSIDTAIPLGLIINEVVSNSLKYAFPKKDSGLIEVRMENEADNLYNLVLKDNGIGIPESINFENTKSLGLQLIQNLVEQLDGSIDIDRASGTKFTIKFSINGK